MAFDSTEAATRAIDDMHMKIYEGSTVYVHYAVPLSMYKQLDVPPSRLLFIGNLPFDITDTALYDMFRDIDNLIDVRVAIDRRTGQLRGYAHAEFLDVESAKKAREILSLKAPHGKKLHVTFSVKRSSVGGGKSYEPR